MILSPPLQRKRFSHPIFRSSSPAGIIGILFYFFNKKENEKYRGNIMLIAATDHNMECGS